MQNTTKIILQSAFACLLLFSGWGFTSLGAYFEEPARVAFLVVLLARTVCETLSLKTGLFSAGRRVGSVPRCFPVLILFAMILLCWILPWTDRRGILTIASSEKIRYLGLALFIVGSTIQLVALQTLGKQYSAYVTLQENHALIQVGLYGVVRHPMYLGLLLNMAGLPLVFRSWLILPVLILVVVFMIGRIHQEEDLLRQEFGADFEAYRSRTKLLVPYVC